jgi:putative N6-adenine-specific DNA methylase
MELQMTAPCLLGLEGLVAEELRQMDAREVTAENGRVFFNGDQAMLARANINSRFAERILIVLDRFTAVTFEELFQEIIYDITRNFK